MPSSRRVPAGQRSRLNDVVTQQVLHTRSRLQGGAGQSGSEDKNNEHDTRGDLLRNPVAHPVHATSCDRLRTPGEGMRWGEAIGLRPEHVRAGQLGIDWQLYELNGRFYRARPKDGSIRPVDLPPFLAGLLASHVAENGAGVCACRNTEEPWCPGDRYVFLGAEVGHFRRSTFSRRFFRPAADGWYPAAGRRPAAPVLADVSMRSRSVIDA